MKTPKKRMRYCPYCRKHTEHGVKEAKKNTAGSARPLGQYSKKRTEYGKGQGNLGRYGSKPAISAFKMTGIKQSKKVDLRFQCSVCTKQHVLRNTFRAKRVALI